MYVTRLLDPLIRIQEVFYTFLFLPVGPVTLRDLDLSKN